MGDSGLELVDAGQDTENRIWSVNAAPTILACRGMGLVWQGIYLGT